MYNLDLWKQRKKELNLTLDDIAEQTGIGISTIKDIFRGATNAPRIDTVQAIEQVLNLSETVQPITSTLSSELISQINALTPEQQEKVSVFIKGLLA